MVFFKTSIIIFILFLFGVSTVSATTEFTSSIQESGGDYSSLSTWEADVNTDLTHTCTAVYSGSITGTLTDGVTLELFRDGTYQSATSTLVATTSTQLLVENYSGLVGGESYVLQTGDQWRVASSTDNMFTVSGSDDELGDDPIIVAQIEGTWTNADTTRVIIDGWTTSATNYIKIYTTTEARHDGKWNTSAYRLNFVDDYAYVIDVAEDYVRIDGLQMYNSDVKSTLFSYRGTGELYLSNNIMRGSVSNQLGNSIYLDSMGLSTVKIWNNIIYDTLHGIFFGYGTAGSTFIIYNNTFVDIANTGINIDDSVGDCTVYLKNNIVFNATTIDYRQKLWTVRDYDYNLGEDAFSGDTHFVQTTQTGNQLFVDYANDDFHLLDGSDAKNTGINLNGDTHLAFTTDIDGSIRSTPWDIGVDENDSVVVVVVDSTPPTISTVASSPSSTTSIITWTTNESATSQVEYGTSVNYGNTTTLDSNLTTSHSINIPSLSTGTTYHYRVKSKDSSDNLTTSSDYTFTTMSPDTIAPTTTSDLSVSSCIATACTLTWTAPGDDNTTGTATTYDVRYSTSNITNDSSFNNATQATTEPTPSIAGTTETISISGLTTGTTYYFALKTSDETPNTSALSNIPTYTTPALDVTAPTTPTNLQVTAVSSSKINLTWTASTDVVGVIGYNIYRCVGSNCTPTVSIATSATNSYSNTDLTAETTYTYAVNAYDASSNTSSNSQKAGATTQVSVENSYLVSETFDDGAFNPPYKYVCGTPEPLVCSNTSKFVDNVKVSGKSLECVYNEKGAAGVIIVPSDYGYNDFGNDTYIRMYINWDQYFKFYHHNKLIRIHGPGVNGIYINANGSGSSGINTTTKTYPVGGSSNTSYADIGVYMTGMGNSEWKYVAEKIGDPSYVVSSGSGWWMIEIHVDSVNKDFDLWVKRPQDVSSTLIYENESLAKWWLDNSVPGNLDFNWINSVVDGSGGKLWIDEIVVSRNYIGPIGGEILPQCSDGIDNDSDGLVDYPNDPGCTSTTDNDEYNISTPTPTTSYGNYKDYIIFEENWDGNNIPSNFPNTRGATYNGWETQTLPPDGEGYNNGFSELSTNKYYSSPRSLHQVKYYNEKGVRDIIKEFSPTKEFRARFYVYFGDSYKNFDRDVVHLIFLQSALSGRGVRLDIRPYVNNNEPGPWNPTCADGQAYLAVTSPQGEGSDSFGVKTDESGLCFNIKNNTGKWVPVEWAYKIVSAEEAYGSLWIDDVEMYKDVLILPDPGHLDIKKLQISGWDSKQLPSTELDYYMDDLVVINKYDVPIGPIDSSVLVCSDGIDNDSDGLIDYPNDPGCVSSTDTDETNTPTDTTPPSRSSGYPTGTLVAGTTSATILITTETGATCKYSTVANTNYASMVNTMTASAGTYSATVSGLTNGSTNNYYVRCSDTTGNVNTIDYTISFNVNSGIVDSTSPTGTISINSGSSATNSQTTTLTLSATDNSGSVSQMSFANESDSFSQWETYTTSKLWNLSSIDGNKTVNVRYKDTSGNISTTASDTIILDTITPTLNNVASVSSSETVGENTVASTIITWNTNENTTSQVEYGFNSNYGNITTLDSTLTNTHTINLTNLSADGTTYHYRVKSQDAVGNEVISIDYTFITPGTTGGDTKEPSTILNLSSSNTTNTSVKLTWTSPSDDYDNSGVGSADIYDIRYATQEITQVNFTDANITTTITGEPTPSTNGSLESMILSGLLPETTYYIALRSQDETGNTSAISNVISFTTDTASTPTCTTFSYSAWSTCQPDNTQSRTVNTSSPDSCTGGTPVLTKSCAYSQSTFTCATFTYSAWNTCQPNNTQSRTVVSSLPSACSGGSPSLSQSCSYVSPTAVASSGGGGGGGGGGSFVDRIAPAQPTLIKATGADKQINLTWKNPIDLDFVRVIIFRSETAIATSNPTSQFINLYKPIYEGSKQEYTDVNLDNNKTYYYYISTYDRNPNYSPVIEIKARPEAGRKTLITKDTLEEEYVPIITTNIAQTELEKHSITFTQDLYFGLQNEEVQKLQEILSHDTEVYPEGITSGYYGSLTVKAIQKFQCKHNLVCEGTPESTGYGVVGPKTRVKLNEVYSASESNIIQTHTQITPTPTPTPTPNQITSLPQTLTTKLTLLMRAGQENEEIKKLQEILAKDETLYPEGIISGYYGNLTVRAVQRFQCKYNIVCEGTSESTGYGVVGPKTRAKLNEVSGGQATQTEEEQTLQLQNQISDLLKLVEELQKQLNSF